MEVGEVYQSLTSHLLQEIRQLAEDCPTQNKPYVDYRVLVLDMESVVGDGNDGIACMAQVFHTLSLQHCKWNLGREQKSTTEAAPREEEYGKLPPQILQPSGEEVLEMDERASLLRKIC